MNDKAVLHHPSNPVWGNAGVCCAEMGTTRKGNKAGRRAHGEEQWRKRWKKLATSGRKSDGLLKNEISCAHAGAKSLDDGGVGCVYYQSGKYPSYTINASTIWTKETVLKQFISHFCKRRNHQNRIVTYWGFRTRMVYLDYITCLRHTILVRNPQCNNPLILPLSLSFCVPFWSKTVKWICTLSHRSGVPT